MDRATEAGWQLRLAILWRGYASLLAAPALKGLAEEVLSRSFVPGLNEIVAGISTRSENALREERTRSLERVRKSAETIGPLISPVETIACWISSARALAGWNSIAASLGADGPEVASRWEHLKQKLGEAKRTGWQMFGRKKDDGWLDEVLRQFDELRAVAGPPAESGRTAEAAHRLRTAVDDVLTEAGSSWPPNRLAILAAKLGPEWLDQIEESAPQGESLLTQIGTLSQEASPAVWLLGRLLLGGDERGTPVRPHEDPLVGVRESAARLERPALKEAIEKLATTLADGGNCTETFLAVLDGLSQPAPTLPEAEAADLLLDRIQMLANTRGCVILPQGWSFRTKANFDPQSMVDATTVAYFHKDVSRGTAYRLSAFGLKQNGGMVRPARVAVSAGPAPDDFGDLLNLIRQRAANVPGASNLADGLQRWQQAALDGTLENVVVQYFAEFWGPMGQSLREHAPNTGAEFGKLLSNLLKKAFRMQAFSPARFDEHPAGWMEVASGSPGRTGRVRAVLRPGLVDSQGCLRVPALVEVE